MAACFSLAAFLALAVVQVLAFPTVVLPDEDALPVWQGFREAVQPEFTPRQHASEMGYTLTKFKWSNCGKSNDPIRIIKLEVQENLVFTMTVDVMETISAPVKLDYSLAKKIGLFYMHVPCSMLDYPCSFPDACKTWSDMMPVCHEDIINNGLPCSCPVAPGRYKVIDLDINFGDAQKVRTRETFQVDMKEYLPKDTRTAPASMVNGDYKMELTMIKPKKPSPQKLLCTAATFTLRYQQP